MSFSCHPVVHSVWAEGRYVGDRHRGLGRGTPWGGMTQANRHFTLESEICLLAIFKLSFKKEEKKEKVCVWGGECGCGCVLRGGGRKPEEDERIMQAWRVKAEGNRPPWPQRRQVGAGERPTHKARSLRACGPCQRVCILF